MVQKIGLALGSGSARGWAHIGVIRRLQEAGIPIDLVSGTSIGAVVAGALADGFLDLLEAWIRELTWSDILGFMDVKFPRSGLIEGERIIQFFRQNLSDARIEELPMPFGAVATDLATGKEIWIQEGSLMDAIRASVSMPGIFTPCRRDNRWLVDGGVVNPIPVSLCRAMGADIVIAVNLNSDLMGKPRFIKREAPAAPLRASGQQTIPEKLADFLNIKHIQGKRFLMKRFGQEAENRDPSLFEVMASSINIMQDRITRQRLAGDPPDVLIAPRLAHIALLEYQRADESITEGYRAMDVMLPLLKDLMT